MRTATEMYDFCKENGYGKGFNEKNSLKHFEIIASNLQPDEDVLFAFIGLHNYVSATKHDNNFAYAVTGKRVLMAQKRVVGQAFQSVALDRINDITFQAGLVFGVITIDALTERFNVAVDKQQATNINARIHDLIFELKATPAQAAAAPVSSADEILKYKQLLDAGAITEEEFAAKKKQLLGV